MVKLTLSLALYSTVKDLSGRFEEKENLINMESTWRGIYSIVHCKPSRYIYLRDPPKSPQTPKQGHWQDLWSQVVIIIIIIVINLRLRSNSNQQAKLSSQSPCLVFLWTLWNRVLGPDRIGELYYEVVGLMYDLANYVVGCFGLVIERTVGGSSLNPCLGI